MSGLDKNPHPSGRGAATPTDKHKKAARKLRLRLNNLVSRGALGGWLHGDSVEIIAQAFADIEAKAQKATRVPDLQSLLNVVSKMDFGAEPTHGKDFLHSFDDLRLFFTEDELASGKVRLIDTPEGE